MSIQSSEILLQVKGKPANAYLAVPENGGPGVLVLHAWWGLKPFFKQVSDRLAEQGFTVLAPDLYKGKTANTIEQAEALLKQRDHEFMGDTVKTARDLLLARTRHQTIGVVGFSLGASWSLVAAADAPDRISAAVLFYGTGGEHFSQIRAKILAHFGDSDEWEPMEGVRAMETDMQAAGLDATFHVYPKAGHWFVEEDRPEYDPAAAKQAWDRTYTFLKKNI
jgi:carboxymethylenebutenolidase